MVSKRTLPPAGSYQQATDLYLPRSMARMANEFAVMASSLGDWGNGTLSNLRVPDPPRLAWILSANRATAQGESMNDAAKAAVAAGAGGAAGAATYGVIGGVGSAAAGTAVGVTLGLLVCIGAGLGLTGYGLFWLGKQIGGGRRGTATTPPPPAPFRPRQTS